MTTRPILVDVGRCLRAGAAPLLTLGVLALARTAHPGNAVSTSMDELVLLVWRGGTSTALLWLLGAVTWPATRPWRDRRAFRRLEHFRVLAAEPDRVLVSVQTTIWSTGAGQHTIVVNVASGTLHSVWLSETTVLVGAFVVLERTDLGVKVIDVLDAGSVAAGHRHEARRARSESVDARRGEQRSREEPQEVDELIRETEDFLRNH